MDEGSGDKLIDSSGNGHHGKIVGAKWVKADGSPITPPSSPPGPLTASMVHKFEGHTDKIRSVAMSRDGKYVVTGSLDGTAILWDAASGEKLKSFTVWTEKVDHIVVAVSDDGKIVAAGSHGHARVWNAASGQELQTFVRPPGYNLNDLA
jgi:WD40 repeat protein